VDTTDLDYLSLYTKSLYPLWSIICAIMMRFLRCRDTKGFGAGTCCSDKYQRQNHTQYTQGEHVAGRCSRGMCQGQNHARKHEGLFYRDMLQRQVPTPKSYAIHTKETCSRVL
jgi:hypothetical protein